jgi:hypothetical protein
MPVLSNWLLCDVARSAEIVRLKGERFGFVAGPQSSHAHRLIAEALPEVCMKSA